MEEKETQETTKDFNLSFLCGVRAHAPPRSFVIHERREHASATCSETGEQTVGLLIVIHSAPAIIIIKFRAHNHSNGHHGPGGSG